MFYNSVCGDPRRLSHHTCTLWNELYPRHLYQRHIVGGNHFFSKLRSRPSVPSKLSMCLEIFCSVWLRYPSDIYTVWRGEWQSLSLWFCNGVWRTNFHRENDSKELWKHDTSTRCLQNQCHVRQLRNGWHYTRHGIQGHLYGRKSLWYSTIVYWDFIYDKSFPLLFVRDLVPKRLYNAVNF